jgi:hypothetical protein
VTLTSLSDLVHDVRMTLSATTHTWDRFVGPDGDKSFFSDLTCHDTTLALQKLGDSFEKLRLLQQKVDLLDKLSKDSVKVVGLVFRKS